MLNVTVVERDRWTRRALGRLLSQADLSVTTHESLSEVAKGDLAADVIVAGASAIPGGLPSLHQPPGLGPPTPFVLIVDENSSLHDTPPPNCRTVPKPIHVSALLTAIDKAAKRS